MDELFRENLANVLEQLDNRLAALEHSVNDVIIQSLKEASDEYEYNDGLEAFKGKYGEIAELEEDLRALHGDDYDTYKSFYDSALSHKDEDGYSEEAFVRDTIDELKKRFSALRGPAAEEEPVVAVVEEEASEPKDESFPSEEELAKELAAVL